MPIQLLESMTSATMKYARMIVAITLFDETFNPPEANPFSTVDESGSITIM
jgi:hypothetical protein